MAKIEIKCSYCGSTDVLKDAYASWDFENQSWELHSTYDENVCNACGGETKGEEVEIPDNIEDSHTARQAYVQSLHEEED